MHFIPVSVQSCVENTLTVTIYQCACACAQVCAQVCMLKCTNPWHVLLKQNRSRWVFIENCAITSVIPLFIMLKISVIQSYVLPFQIWSLSTKKNALFVCERSCRAVFSNKVSVVKNIWPRWAGFRHCQRATLGVQIWIVAHLPSSSLSLF